MIVFTGIGYFIEREDDGTYTCYEGEPSDLIPEDLVYGATEVHLGKYGCIFRVPNKSVGFRLVGFTKNKFGDTYNFGECDVACMYDAKDGITYFVLEYPNKEIKIIKLGNGKYEWI